MPDDRKQMLEIAELESWLSGHLSAEPVPGLERLKLRVRLEVGEQWLGCKLPDFVSTGNKEVRDRVRAEVWQTAQAKVSAPSPMVRGVYRIVGASAGMAALLALAILLARPAKQAEVNVSMFEDDNLLPEESDDLDFELDELEDELADLDGGLAFGDAAVDEIIDHDFESESGVETD